MATELRIGNIVRSKVNGISKVEQIGSSLNPDYVGGRSLEGNYWENSYLPIEITEEWLERMGFVKDTQYLDTWYHGQVVNLTIDTESHKAAVRANHMDYDWLKTPYKHVHQIQNLYYALTGEELEIR